MQHALKMLTHRINIISGLTLESQNESWDQFSGEVLLTEGLSQQKGFNSLIYDSGTLGDIATHNTQPSRTPDRGPFVHHQVVWQ